MAMIRPETEMKYSGLAWEKFVPIEWNKCRLKDYFEFEKGKNAQIYTKDYIGLHKGSFPVYSGQTENDGVMGEIDTYDYELDECLFSTTVGAKVMTPKVLSGKFSLSQNCLIMRKIRKCVIRFVYYTLFPLFDYERAKIPAYMQPSLRIEDLKTYNLYMPLYTEQKKIADYLDKTCLKIEEIIAEAKASIDEYKELKQSVIFEAVTKGLDKNAEMKDSGYDFIGCIPSEWEMCKVRHLGTAQNGISIGGDAFGSGHPFVSYGDVYKNYSLPKTVDKLVQSSEEDRKRYSVKKGDWFFTRTSETIEEVGFSCVCEETIPDAVFAGFLIRVRPFNNRIYTGFAKYYFRSNHLRTFFVKEMNLVTRASLAQGLLKDAPVVVPPYDEQIEIANYLENKCEIIDGIIKDKESTINDLEAYKKSLIYEVVTGKRRVV